jgi:CPA2 family monovalent cation:H+ antiporter-2
VVAAWAAAAGYAPAKSLFLGFLVVGLTLVLARRVVPFGLRVISRTRRRDLFILAVVVVCAGIAWLTSHPRHFSRAKPRQRSPQSR